MRRTSRRFRLWHLSVGLLVCSGALLGYLASRSGIDWAWTALELHAEGQTTTPIEHRLERQALALLQRGGDPAEARDMLLRALAIDPYSKAVHTLGDVYLRQGDTGAARRQYEHYLTLDPSHLPTYLRLIEVYEALGLPAERARLVESGIEYFSANVEAYAPRPDDDVYSVYNDKAYGVYNAYRESLLLLRQQVLPE